MGCKKKLGFFLVCGSELDTEIVISTELDEGFSSPALVGRQSYDQSLG